MWAQVVSLSLSGEFFSCMRLGFPSLRGREMGRHGLPTCVDAGFRSDAKMAVVDAVVQALRNTVGRPGVKAWLTSTKKAIPPSLGISREAP